MSEAGPARGESSVGNVGGAGSREPLPGRDGAICSVVVHTRLFDGAKVVFFFVAIRSEMEVLRPRRHEGVRWRFRSPLRVADTAFTGEKEVPLDAARCRHSVHLREGGSARRCALPTQRSLARRRFRSTLHVSRNDVPRKGQKREKMGGGDGVTGNGAPFPAAHLFPSPHPATHVIPPPTIGGGGIPSSQVSAAAVADSPPMTDV